MSITKVFLNKSGIVDDFLFSWSLLGARSWGLANIWLLTLVDINTLVRVLALNESWCLFGSSDLKHWVLVNLLSLTFFTQIKVMTNTAFVSDSLNWTNLTAITSNTGMHLGLLVSSSLSKVINHQSLESLGSIGMNFFSKHLNQVIEEFAVEGTWSVASSARKSFLINFGTITSEADNSFLLDGFFLFVWSDYLTVDFLFNHVSSELTTFTLCLNGTVTAYFLHILLALGCHILSVHYSTKLLFVGVDLLGVYGHVVESN